MECQECHENPATLHFKHVINGEERKLSLCEACAKKKGYVTFPEEGYSLHDLLTGLFNVETLNMNSTSKNQMKQLKEIKCSSCGMTFSEFKKIGKFGCANCYSSFAQKVEPIFRRVHAGNTKHNGKIPKRTGINLQTRRQIELYKQELKNFIDNEEFEKAAEYRDKIKELQAKASKKDDLKEGDDQ
ncbi:UvrB/UvrC motif-containing protein [Oceanobacillus kimchii]|uniref:Protein-arginine kinase activator protein n=1 Tax=Oceanobacillus kimchii TaxID=746691 RepID=A0ABQ5TEF6_9BACI|nr:UvrB/UvrC motif-containing protein [Oceanobacillus kimchii]GLO64305.1 protein-arginine kinase activator protein [Oceanobacillus kimchii]